MAGEGRISVTPGKSALRNISAEPGQVVVPPVARNTKAAEHDAAVASSPVAPTTPSSVGGVARLHLSGSARRVLASGNASIRAFLTDATAPARVPGNRSTGDHVLNRRPQAPSTPVRERADSITSNGAQRNSVLKSGAKRVFAPVAPSPSPVRVPLFSAVARAKPTSAHADPARSPAPPQPHRTPSRVSLALEELTALGYTPSRLSMRAFGDDPLTAEVHCPEAPAAADAPPQLQADTAPLVLQGSPQPSSPPAAHSPDGRDNEGAAQPARGRACVGLRVGCGAQRVAVPFALPPAGSMADAAAAIEIGRSLLRQAALGAASTPTSARKAKRGARELEALGDAPSGGSCAKYAVARVADPVHKAQMGADEALTPVRRSARCEPRHQRAQRARASQRGCMGIASSAFTSRALASCPSRPAAACITGSHHTARPRCPARPTASLTVSLQSVP